MRWVPKQHTPSVREYNSLQVITRVCLSSLCLSWLENIKENSSVAQTCGDLWVKWNRSLVSIWKHNKVMLYSDPCVDMIVWADKEKFARWERFLPVPKIRLRRERSGDDGAVPPSAHPPSDPSSSIAGSPDAGVSVPSSLPEVAIASDLPLDVDLLAPLLGSDWSGFEDELAGPFLDLPPVLPTAPSRATLNLSHKRARSPDPPSLLAQATPSSSPHPALDCGYPGLRPTRWCLSGC